jgi:ATP-dependent Clp protease protease subunit
MAYSLVARGKEADLHLYGPVGGGLWEEGVTARQVAKDLKAVGAVSTLNVHIYSEGGGVFEGMAIYNALRQFQARKVVRVEGLAASIASVIAMVGDEILIGDGSFMMIHNARGGAFGGSAEMRRVADLIDTVSAEMVEVYAGRTRQKREKLREWMSAGNGDGTYMTAAEAVERGFADRVTESVRLAASLPLDRLPNPPEALQRAVASARMADAQRRARIAAAVNHSKGLRRTG